MFFVFATYTCITIIPPFIVPGSVLCAIYKFIYFIWQNSGHIRIWMQNWYPWSLFMIETFLELDDFIILRKSDFFPLKKDVSRKPILVSFLGRGLASWWVRGSYWYVNVLLHLAQTMHLCEKKFSNPRENNCVS